jgi:hypothetical protein
MNKTIQRHKDTRTQRHKKSVRFVIALVVSLCPVSLCLCIFLFAGCSTVRKTEINTVTNPDHTGRQYSRLLVTAQGREKGEVLRAIESAVVAELTRGRPELTFAGVRNSITLPLSRRKISDFTKKNNIEARLELVVTRNFFKESDQLSRELSQGLQGSPPEVTLGLQATLIDIKKNTEVWVGQTSLICEVSQSDDAYVLLGRVIAEQLVETQLLSLE